MNDLSSYPFSIYDEDDEVDENDQLTGNYPVEDEIHPQRPIPPVQNERGGRRKGVPRRLQLSPDVVKSPTHRLLPHSLMKPVAPTVHHHDQPILTSDQEDDNESDELYQGNPIEGNYLQLELIDNNNNLSQIDEDAEEIFEIVDDILADMVTIIVRDIKQQRRKLLSAQNHFKMQTKLTNGKHSNNETKSFSTKLATKSTDSPQPLVKHKLSPSSSSPSVKRQKTLEASTSSSLQQQLLWEMTQQLMMSAAAANETESLAAVNSSLLKQQLLGLSQTDSLVKNKSQSRPSKPRAQSPVMPSNGNNLNTSFPSSSTSPFDRGNFAPRRRGRPPKYVNDRALAGLSSLDLDPTALTASYDQLLSAIENGANGTTAAAFQTALASMLGQQAGLAMPTAPPVVRNGTPASMLKNGAGQTRHSLPAGKLSTSIDMPLMATKKRGPGRPPKSQTLFDSHQILQATQRLNSSSNHFPPTMVPQTASAASNSFNFNAAFAEMLQQQHQF